MPNATRTPHPDRVAEHADHGRPIMPTTIEGRLALLMAVLIFVPFIGGVMMLATPVMLFLAWRRGDRAWLLVVPLLGAVFLVVFVTAEIFFPHD